MQQLTDNTEKTSPDLGLTMTQVLRNPLAALRAAMESVAGEFRADDPRAPTLRAALEQVLAMSRDVEALIDWTKPRTVVPMRCTASEILQVAVRKLVFEQSSRVQVVDDARGRTLFVDAAVLGDSLHLLLRGVLASGAGDVLLRAGGDGATTTFSIIQQRPDAAGADDVTNLPSEREKVVLLLGSELARRDIERAGGRISIERTNLGNLRVTVSVTAREGDLRA